MAKAKGRRRKASVAASPVDQSTGADNPVDKVEEPVTVPPLSDEAVNLITQRVNASFWGTPEPTFLDKMLTKLRRKADEASSQW